MHLTAKMATQRLANSGECVSFIPFNEGAGTTFTDVIGGAIVTDASAVHTALAHAPAIGTAVNASLGSGDLVTIPADKHVVFIYGTRCVTLSAFVNGILGTSTGARVAMAVNTPAMEDDDGNEKSFTATTAISGGQDAFVMAVLDRSGTAYTYESINGAGASLKGSSAHTVTGSITIPMTGTFGNTGTRQPQYGLALYAMDELPSSTDLIASLDYCEKHWSRGFKMLPPQLS